VRRLVPYLSLFLLATPLAGHEFGALRVDLAVEEGALAVDLLVDVAHIFPGSVPFPEPSPPWEERARFATEFLADRSEVAADGAPLALGRRGEPPRFDAPGSTSMLLRLVADLPEGWKQVSYRQQAQIGQYAIRSFVSGPDPVIVWSEGAGAPLSIARAEAAPSTRRAVFLQYLGLGFTHILPKGLDHIAFVLGLFLLSPRWKPLLVQVSAFTIAHSITLALSIYGVVSLSPAIVEPLIALSIAYVAFENLATKELKPWRPAVVFAFGLLHGLGFAGVLSELGLPRDQFLNALVAFNLGVEAGQLAVLALAFLLMAWPFARQIWYRRAVTIPGSLLIGLLGLFWTVQRALGGG
jgi:hypothetical protein